MSNVLDNTKSTLGKLLATENIRIEHRQVQGPSFDVQNRVLVLPIWKEVDADLYDLMIGHEVGHALYTPTDGWIERVKELGENFKGVLNIVEDARIEKFMKRKFPGLRKPMYNGYTQLLERGFFGVELDDMKHLPFLDRVNVHFKLGPRANIQFTESEQLLVTRIENTESWDEVMMLSEELFKIAGDEFKNLSNDIVNSIDELANAIENMKEGESEYTGSAEDTGSAEFGKSLQDVLKELRAAGKHEAADKLERMASKQKYRQAMIDWAESQEMGSITNDSLEKNQVNLIDTEAYPITYTFWPTLDHKKFVIPAKIVHAILDNEINSYISAEKLETLYYNFMSTNRGYISYLVKEFELKRNAKQLAKTRISKTGKLDVNKVWRYKLSEDLFLQSAEVPNGKNHGMLMIVDLSSSMQNNMAGTIEQIVNLAMFCRRVNIPFDVYGFSDTNGHFDYAMAENRYVSKEVIEEKIIPNDTRQGSLLIANTNFRLRQLLHYKMGAAEFNKSVKNLLYVANAFKSSGNYYYYSSTPSAIVPPSMYLGGTPLNEAVLVLRSLAEQFKKNTKVEVLNTILLTDGDGSYGLNYVNGNETSNVRSSYGGYTGRIVVEDRASKKQVMVSNHGHNITLSLLELYRQTTGSRVIGFYLMSGSSNRYRQIIYTTMQQNTNEFNSEGFDRQYAAEFTKHKYFGLKLPGYDVYYMVPGEELEVDAVDMNKVLKGYKNVQTKGSLLKAFKKMQNSKMISRVFLNKFIEHVA
jgi:hypothetical protein